MSFNSFNNVAILQIAKDIDIDQEINEIEECKKLVKKFDLDHDKESSVQVKNESNESFLVNNSFRTNSMCSMDDSIESESNHNEDNDLILANLSNDLSEKKVNSS